MKIYHLDISQFSCSVMSNSLQPHESQHARPPCPSPTPKVYPNPCPLSWWCHPAISSSVVSFSSCPQIPSIRVFSNESTLRMRWPKYWSFIFSISPSKEHPGLISFRMNWLDLLVVQGTLKSLLQHHTSKASVFQHSAFFTIQLSHPYMTTGKTIALTRQTFVGKVMSLLLNMLSRLVITFLPRYKRLLISWLQSPSAVILEPPKNKVWHCFPIYFPWSDGTSLDVLLSDLEPVCCSMAVVPCPVLTVASWSAYRFLRRQVRWSGIPISLRISHSLLWSTQSKALT